MRHPAYAFAEQLDRTLGDPNDPRGVFSYRRCAALDRREEFPAAACAQLDALGLHRYYVPASLGGALEDYEFPLMLVRFLARRDFTVALAHSKTYLGCACVWMCGEERQAKELAGKVLDGAVVSLALTEAAHGSDLLAGDTVAERTATGYRIDGEKWLINNATHADLICVLARSEPAGGPRGFSVLLVSKQDLGAGSCRSLAAVPTHGVRGADISGVSFVGAEVPPDAVVGERAGGVEVVLKSLQVSRTLCAGPSLGMADHALRIAVDFATRHRLYDRTLIDLGYAARTLAVAYTELLIAEAVALVSTRSIHTLPGELSVISAVVKYWVPTTVDAMIAALGGVLGARALLTESFADGRFQKVVRDHQIVGIFDGNTYVNLTVLIGHFPALARGYRRHRVDTAGVATALTLATAKPSFDSAELRLVSHAGCSLVQGLPDDVDELVDLAQRGVIPASLAELGRALRTVVEDVHLQMAQYRPSARDVPPEAFTLATHYAHCYAAAACLGLWLRNHAAAADGATEQLWAGGRWLEACLGLLLARLRPSMRPHQEAVDQLTGQLRDQHHAGQLFSLLPCQLAGERRLDPDGR